MGRNIGLYALTLVLLAGALLVACGGDDDELSAPSGGATAARATPRPTSEAVPGAPAGYERSCAQFHPWGRPVQFAFACIDEPRAGQPQSGTIVAHGYAGGAPQAMVVVELREPGGRVLVKQTVAYRPLEANAPGRWETNVPIPSGTPGGPARFAVYFTNPADGKVMSEGTSDIFLAPPQPVGSPIR